MKTQEIIDIENKYSVAGFKKRPYVLVKGKGAKVYDSENREYIDCVAGIGVANIGHCNRQVVDAIKKQLDSLMITPPLLHNEKRALLLKKLCGITGLSKAFLCNSGTEANEAAIKFARVSTKKTDIIATVNCFHGRTYGSLSATWKKEYREPFMPLVAGFSHVPFNNFDRLKETVTGKTAAIILELVQGEGGINIADKEYVANVRKLCDEKNVILIIDEVQTGFGRTGEMFAYQHYNIKPDIVTMAKSIAGGMPMGAVVCNEKIDVPDKLHANTFGGYPVACVAALASIDFIEKENLCEKSEELGRYFVSELKKIKSNKIRDVRSLGLMVGVELKEKPQEYVKQLMEKGVMVLTSGLTVLRFLPPLVISKEEINVVVEKVKEVLSD